MQIEVNKTLSLEKDGLKIVVCYDENDAVTLSMRGEDGHTAFVDNLSKDEWLEVMDTIGTFLGHKHQDNYR